MSEIVLKPCPFCGDTHEWEDDILSDGYYESGIICRNRILVMADPSKKEHAELFWNTRPIEDNLRQINRNMKESLDIALDLGQQRFEKLEELRGENQRMKDALENILGMIAGHEKFSNCHDWQELSDQDWCLVGDMVDEIREMAELGLSEVNK